MKLVASAMLAPETALLAGLLGFVLAALLFALAPSRRAVRREGTATDHPHFWQLLLRKGGQAVAVLDGGARASLSAAGPSNISRTAGRRSVRRWRT